jgi:hypothetical protein
LIDNHDCGNDEDEEDKDGDKWQTDDDDVQ